MPTEDRYRVTDATLVVTEDGTSAWKLVFALESSPRHSQAENRIEITLSPEAVDNMFFGATYTCGEIGALRDGDPRREGTDPDRPASP
jgi:hypothetical protein